MPDVAVTVVLIRLGLYKLLIVSIFILVELVGIEPTTSSLRTMRSPFPPVFTISGLRSVSTINRQSVLEH